MKNLFLLISFLLIISSTQAQDPYAVENEIGKRLHLFGYHPWTGDLLPTKTPHPILGVPGDDNPDKLQIQLFIVADTEDYNMNLMEQGIIQHLAVKGVFYPVDEGESGIPNANMGTVTTWEEQIGEEFSTVNERSFIIQKEIPLTFDISHLQRIAYIASLMFKETEVSSFYTEIIAGNPELTMHSQVTTNNMIMDDVAATSVVSGRTGLVFDQNQSTLKGRGMLTYESFEIKAPRTYANCSVPTKTKDGPWRAEVVFPNSLNQSEPNLEGMMSIPLPQDVIILIEPKISESGKIKCPQAASPIRSIPLPKLIHFFAVFYSWHGGEIDVTEDYGDPTDQLNEMNEDRGGLVMTNWQPGEGNIIASRTYKRAGKAKKVSFEEHTVLELKWPGSGNSVPICHQLENGDSHTIYVNEEDVSSYLAQGDFEGECMVTVCHQLGQCASQIISIPESELPGHLAHGDYVGECLDCCFSGFLESTSFTRFCNNVTNNRGTFYMTDDGDVRIKVIASPEGSLCEISTSEGETISDTTIPFVEAQICLQKLMCIANELGLQENCD